MAVLRKQAPDDRHNSGASAELAVTLIAEHKFPDAETITRERLEFLQKRYPDGGWSVFSAQILLGESLLGQKKYAGVEALLLSGYEGMERRKREGLVLDSRYRRQPQQQKALEPRRVEGVVLQQVAEYFRRSCQAFHAVQRSECAEDDHRQVGDVAKTIDGSFLELRRRCRVRL